MKKKIMILAIIIIIALVQLFQIDKSNPPVNKATAFATVNNTPNGVQNLLSTSCYDCHSNETKYPWYSYIVPLSYWIKHHIDEGREELNFSEWGTYSEKRKAKKIEECIEMISESEMPPAYYTWMHKGTALNASASKLLTDYFNGLKNNAPGSAPESEQQEHE